MNNNFIKKIKNKEAWKKIKNIFPVISNWKISKINIEIFDYGADFISDENILISALIQNPFNETLNLEEIGKNFGSKVKNNIRLLNEFQAEKISPEKFYGKSKQLAVLFLINYIFIFKYQKQYKKESQKMLSLQKTKVAFEILEKDYIGKIRQELDDKFFSILAPKIYRHYKNILKLTKKAYLENSEKIKKEIGKFMEKNNIDARIESRFKSIFSLHNKIAKKKLMLSQVLDIIGVRVIVRRIQDCYKAMELFISEWPVINNSVKDYISVPKENGYQSIHLAVFYKGFPLEIQIRTAKMHFEAQYGKASYLEYKKNE